MNAENKCVACLDGSRNTLVSWGDDNRIYAGRISDRTWNGFAMPAFTAEVAREIANDSRGVEGLCQIKEINTAKGVAFEITSPDFDESEIVEATDCCGLYFIGDWWTWGEVEHGDLPQYTRAHLVDI